MKTPIIAPRQVKPTKEKKPTVSPVTTPEHPPQNTTDVENILQLQRLVGNQGVMRMLDVTPTNRPVIQRAGGDFGLKTKGNTSGFVSEAVAFWKNAGNKDKPLEDYATHLVNKVNSTLTAACTTQFISSGGDSGSFSRTTWIIKINTSKFSENSSTDTVGKLTADEAAEVADTIYHEARHSEQYFSAGQIMAGEGSDAQTITTSLSIPAEVAAKAVANPIKADKKNKDMITAVKDWQSIGAGIHATYKGLVNNFMDPTEELTKTIKNVDTSNLETTKSGLDTTLGGLKTTQLKNFKDELTRLDSMKTKSKGDKLVESHAKKIVKLLEGIIDTWEKDKTRSVATIQKLGGKAKSLEKEVYEAYRDHLHEKDAWAVGGAAGSQFRKLAKKK